MAKKNTETQDPEKKLPAKKNTEKEKPQELPDSLPWYRRSNPPKK